MLVLSHGPDVRYVDSEQLLRVVKRIIRCAATSELQFDIETGNLNRRIESFESDEPIGWVVDMVSWKMMCRSSDGRDLQACALELFDWLSSYKWDTKVVLILAAFANSYGRCCLSTQLGLQNPLAKSLSILKHLRRDFGASKSWLKVLTLAIKEMFCITASIIKYASLPVKEFGPNKEAVDAIESVVYVAAFRIAQGSLTSSSHILDLMTATSEEQNGCLKATATWELASLVCRLGNVHSRLRILLDKLQQQIEEKIENRLVSLSMESQPDNQEVLGILFRSRDGFPLKQIHPPAKIGISELQHKVIVLMISDLGSITPEEWLLLAHQTNPRSKDIEERYAIVWLPMLRSELWTDEDERRFEFLSGQFPGYSIRNPASLSPAISRFIRKTWRYQGETVGVTIDTNGAVTNLNNIDMVLIWGVEAYPFSVSREEDLWQCEEWGLPLIFGSFDMSISESFEEGKNICIYGSTDPEWIRWLSTKMEIISNGIQLDFVYVGKTSLIQPQSLGMPLSPMQIRFFWLRLESMRRSRLRLGKTAADDHILRELSALLDFDDNHWAIFGVGSSADTLRLQGDEMTNCLNLFPEWGKNVREWGLLNAIRTALVPPTVDAPCEQSMIIIPYEQGQGSNKGFRRCANCEHPCKSYVVYQ
ncbi:hypothetical protein MLD38_009399 [Melastoma candidum]|uniref:Uncharacterized protein n=1 Tax=Melastoma candidum TaxID=119954 RepID=A0ACB9RWK8_9MYRT|nr:hypothetical protein MLD38_009399 [Melastoma candidum]